MYQRVNMLSTIFKDINGLTHGDDCDTGRRTPDVSGHLAPRFIPLRHRGGKGLSHYLLYCLRLQTAPKSMPPSHIDGLTHGGDSDTDCRTPNASGHPAFRFIPLLHCRGKGEQLTWIWPSNNTDNRTPLCFRFTFIQPFLGLNMAISYLDFPNNRTTWQIASSVPK